MVKHMPSPAIRMFNMTCLFENTKLYLHTVRFAPPPRWGYIGVLHLGAWHLPIKSKSLSLSLLLGYYSCCWTPHSSDPLIFHGSTQRDVPKYRALLPNCAVPSSETNIE